MNNLTALEKFCKWLKHVINSVIHRKRREYEHIRDICKIFTIFTTKNACNLSKYRCSSLKFMYRLNLSPSKMNETIPFIFLYFLISIFELLDSRISIGREKIFIDKVMLSFGFWWNFRALLLNQDSTNYYGV